MADEPRAESSAAVADRRDTEIVAPDPAPQPDKKRKKKQQDDEDYGLDFSTPFGMLEFALEPTSQKERKDEERREKSARDAAKAAAKAEKKADKERKNLGIAAAAEQAIIIRRGGSKLLPILIIFAIVAGAFILAVWLFARPGDEEVDAVPAEFRNDGIEPAPEPKGFAATAQSRIRAAIRAGRSASREAQQEQERKFQDLTKG